MDRYGGFFPKNWSRGLLQRTLQKVVFIIRAKSLLMLRSLLKGRRSQ